MDIISPQVAPGALPLSRRVRERIAGLVSYCRTRPKRSLAAFVLLAVVAWSLWPDAGEATRYVLTAVERGSLIVSVTGTGQVEATRQMELTPEGSGDVVTVAVTTGQVVRTGQLLVQLDAADEYRDYQNAKAALEKLLNNQPSDAAAAAQDLSEAYEDAHALLTDISLELPDVLETARAILYDDTLDGVCALNTCAYDDFIEGKKRIEAIDAFVEQSETDFETAQAAYDDAIAVYRTLRRDSAPDELIHALDGFLDANHALAQALKSEQSLLDTVVGYLDEDTIELGSEPAPVQLTEYQASVGTALGMADTLIAQLTASERNIETALEAVDDQRTDAPLELADQQAEVADRLEALSDRAVRAPFDGTIVSVDVQKGDSVSAATTVATLLAEGQIARLELNEVDAAMIENGQKATLTFDAIEDLSIAATVADLDAVGNVSQGVVTYEVVLSFDSSDERVKPGMSVSASVITASVADTLVVPSGVVKTRSGVSYATVYEGTPPSEAYSTGFVPGEGLSEVEVTTGLSNDTQIEILSGLAEGDLVVLRASTNGSSTGSSAPSLLNAAGGSQGGFRPGQ